MSEKILDQEFWQARWEKEQTNWDIGYASPAISEYTQQLVNRDIEILIPGCGNAYEAIELTRQGFKNITLLDIAPKVVTFLQEKCSKIPTIEIICADFFEHKGKYDLILEQTFFCALDPALRAMYVQKSDDLLNAKGKIAGVLFDRSFEITGPPFGGNVDGYKKIFESRFKIKTMAQCYNSIAPRNGSEVFIIFEKA